MRISLELTKEEIIAVSIVLNADAAGLSYSESDRQIRDEVCTRFVSQAAVLHQLESPSVLKVFERGYTNFGRIRRNNRLVKSRRTV